MSLHANHALIPHHLIRDVVGRIRVPAFQKLLREAGWNGVFNEVLEERVAEIGHGLLEEFGLGDQLFRLPSFEQLAQELVAFSIPAVGINLTQRTLEGGAPVGLSIEDVSGEQIEEIVREFEQLEKGEAIDKPLEEISLGNNVSVTRRTIKHVVEQRGERARDLIRSIPDILANPTKIADNSDKRENSFLYAKINGRARATVLEVTKTPDGNHQVVSVFLMDEKTFRKLNDVSGRSDIPSLDISPVESEISTAQRTRETVAEEGGIGKGTKTEARVARGEKSSPFVRKRETTLLKGRIRNIARGVREGRVETKREIQAAQNQLVNIIDSSELSLKDKGKFRKTVKNVQTKEQLERAVPNIEKRIDKLEKAERFRSARSQIKKAIKSTKIKNRVSKFPAKLQDTMQKMFDTFRADIKLTQDKAKEKMEQLQKEIDGNIPTMQQKLRMTLLGIQSGSDFVTEEDAQKLADDLTALIEQGKTLKDLETFVEWQELQNDIESVEGALDLGEGVETFGTEKKTFLEGVKNRLKIFGVKALTDWQGLMEDIDWNRPVGEKQLKNRFKTTPNNSRYADLYGRYNKELNKVVRESYEERFQEKLKALPSKIRNSLEFSPWTESFISRLVITDLINEKVNLGKLTNRDGVTKELEMTRGELIKRWIELQDPTLDESFVHGNRYGDGVKGDDFFAAIDKAMTPQDKAFASEAMRMWQELYDILNPIYKAVYGINLPRNPFYSLIQREGFEIDIEKKLGEFLGE